MLHSNAPWKWHFWTANFSLMFRSTWISIFCLLSEIGILTDRAYAWTLWRPYWVFVNRTNLHLALIISCSMSPSLASLSNLQLFKKALNSHSRTEPAAFRASSIANTWKHSDIYLAIHFKHRWRTTIGKRRERKINRNFIPQKSAIWKRGQWYSSSFSIVPRLWQRVYKRCLFKLVSFSAKRATFLALGNRSANKQSTAMTQKTK